MRPALVGIVLVAACGGSAPAARFVVQAVSSASTDGRPTNSLTMNSGEVRTIELMVIGPVPGAVSVSMKDAPEFATLRGQLLTLSPTRGNQGDYPITLVAESEGQKAATTLTVSVVRPNSPPSLGLVLLSGGIHDMGTCPDPKWCTVVGTPSLAVITTDAEGDAVTIDVELVRRGEPFTGTPTYSGTSQNFPLDGLTPGQSYEFAIRACDQVVLCASPTVTVTGIGGPDDSPVNLGNGWVTAARLGFDQGPCAAGQCACKPSGTWAMAKDDCCSGTIVWLPPSPTTPNGFPVCQ